MGCWMHARLQAAGLFAADACVDCAWRPRESSLSDMGGPAVGVAAPETTSA
jgi:hypothetical protein